MTKKLLFCWALLLCFTAVARAQDSVVYRVILIGDAGEIDKEQKAVLGFAANSILKDKTTVMYLGDNIYPNGMALPGSPDEERTKNILQSEYTPMRAKGASVYFIPGNHDWDRMGPDGLEKIKRQWQYLADKKDSLLKLVPENGCPDPYEIKVNDKLTIIAFDSEWWLFPYNKVDPGSDCNCKTKDDIVNKLRELFYKNRDKVIILASHHPFQSYGVHGGVYSFNDHVFPLTAVNKDLYIPLPVVGSVYPLLRTVFADPEDLGHPLYKEMIKKVDGIFKDFPNLIHVAGHDHGLQFIKNEKGGIQVVSGAGSKDVHVKKGKNSLFADAVQGFVTADLMKDNSMRFTYYIYTEQGIKQAFTYTKLYETVAPLNERQYKNPVADSITVSIHPVYDSVSGVHRAIFGENYRKEWAAKVKLPYIKLSQIHGGLSAERKGGGMQTQSLRLIDPDGNEWVLRTVEKDPTKLLPDALKPTFAFDLLDDATSAQHPFGSLVVPPIADALEIPHANPIIGVVAPDKNLGQYAPLFINRVCLLEEREAGGKSDNTLKMEQTLAKDNDNHFKGEQFIRARMLDVLIGDWDRHEDQWRWRGEKDDDGNKMYTAVPRDRDQALYTRQGLVENLASARWILPTLQGFDGKISDVRYSIFKTRFMNPYPESIVSYGEWMRIANDVKKGVTDSVLEAALRRLPPEIYKIRHDELLRKFKQRRDNLPAAMDEYYRFSRKVADIRLSDKNEQVRINDAPNGGLSVTAVKINRKGKLTDTILKAVYDASITKEVRLFVADGDDNVIVDTKNTDVKLRIVGGDGQKEYQVINANNKIKLYGKTGNHTFSGDSSRFITHFNNDTANFAIHNTNLYNIWMPLATANINKDDGFLFGLGFRYTGQEGFRKTPYTTLQELMVTHSFTTKAFSINYKGDWNKAVGSADLVLQAIIKAPDNTMNFFGRGNGSVYDRSLDFARYYRIRFDTYDFNPALRWHTTTGSSFSIGPSISYYHLDQNENTGRFINNTSAIGSYDSTTINKDKLHAGVIMNFLSDKRNSKLFPTSGIYFDVKLMGYTGLNSYSKSFAQLIPELALYRSLGTQLVIAERMGGGITVGQTAFYQSLFLGGQGNLLGYRQNRFAGQDMFYNNLEARLKLGDLSSYVLPGQFGLSGFYDIGRVWDKTDQSNTWHQGVGGGFYFAPAGMFVLQIQAGYSVEGWYPAISFQFRF